MACAVAFPVLAPSGDFPAWLEAQGVNAEVARAMDSELGIRDYGVLRACVGDGLVRAELLATARDRLPFGFYAVLRQVVKALQGADTHDGGTTPGWDADAVTAPGDVTLGGLVDVLLALFSGLSRELLLSVQRLGDIDNTGTCPVVFSSAPLIVPPEDERTHTSDDDTEKDMDGNNLVPDIIECQDEDTSPMVKTEAFEGAGGIEGISDQNVVSLQEMGLHIVNDSRVGSSSRLQQKQQQWQTSSKKQRNSEADEMENISLHSSYTFNPLLSRCTQRRQEPPNIEAVPCNVQQNPAFSEVDPVDHQTFMMESSSQEENGDVCSDKRYECTICNKRFAWRSLLKYHFRIHTGEKPYRCNICKRSFTTSGNLRVHERTHTGVKPYQCNVCNKCFKQSHHLKCHQRTHWA